MKNLIGKKAKGFWFESRKHKRLSYVDSMDNHIGEVGEITSYLTIHDCYRIDFKNDWFHYPASEIESHLVDEWVVGEEYEFTHDTMNGWNKRLLLAILPDSCQDRYIVTSGISEKGWTYMSEIRQINQPNKEILDQIKVLEKELENLKSKVN